MVELDNIHAPLVIVADPRGPAGAWSVTLENALDGNLKVTAGDQQAPFGLFCNKVCRFALRHLGTPELGWLGMAGQAFGGRRGL